MLKGKTALVTGSTSGIGLGIARELANQGANIMLNGLKTDYETVMQIRAEIESFGVKADYNGADVSKQDQVAAMVEDTVAKFGTIDILVNNAGVQHVSPIEQFPIEKWDALISILLSSAFYSIRQALPHMRKQGWGRIINIASAHGLVASANKSAYVASKHGLIGLSKVTALETAGSGITCNTICPGWVLTPLVQKQIDAIAERDGLSNEEASIKLLSEKQPSKQFATPEEIGSLAVFLCSPAAKQMTGSAYSIDGGWTAQ